jgi:uncharacterized protein YciI
MYFAVSFRNPPGSEAMRAQHVEAHRAYLKATQTCILAGGAIAEADGKTLCGGLYIIEANDLAAAQKWVDDDPFTKAGIRIQMKIDPWLLAVYDRAYVLGRKPDAPLFPGEAPGR